MSVTSQSKDSSNSSDVMQEFMAEFKMSFDRSYSNMFNTILKESLFLDVAALCPEGLLFKSMRVKVAGDMSAAKLSMFALLRVKKVLRQLPNSRNIQRLLHEENLLTAKDVKLYVISQIDGT